MICLCLALWPRLAAIYRRLLRHFRTAPGELVCQLAGGLTDGGAPLDLNRATRIAATLLRNTERDVRRMLKARRAEACDRKKISDAVEFDSEPLSSQLGLPVGFDPDGASDSIVGLPRIQSATARPNT